MILKNLFLALIALTLSFAASSQVVLNEIQAANLESFPDEDGDFKDWFEIFNNSASTVNLGGWSVSDRPDNPGQWMLPAIDLAPGEHHIIWASGKDRGSAGPSFETAIEPVDEWNYLLPTSEPDAAWRLPGFNTTGWSEGPGGFGYADGDDGTTVDATASVYFRREFDLTEIDQVLAMVLHMDFDDGFIAFINGTEIARFNAYDAGYIPVFSDVSSGDHEANGYQGAPIDAFVIDMATWAGSLNEGENVLAIQLYNTGIGSSDLTGNAWLTFAFATQQGQFPQAPAWMGFGGLSPELHTNFALSSGETLVLASSGGVIEDEIVIASTATGHSMARQTSGGAIWCFSPEPTPGGENGNTECALAYEEKPEFNINSGLYGVGQTVTITAPNPTAEIRYTLDGSIPTASSELYTGPLEVNETMVVSARCFSTIGLLPSLAEKNTYLINEWGLEIPIISISSDPDNLWSEETGIYVFGPLDDIGGYPYFGANFWQDWERNSYIEYFTPDGQLQFEGPVGLKIHGGWSRALDQKSLRVVCRDDYGMENISYPLIPDKSFIPTFESFNLRNGGNEYWGPRYHDALMQRVMKPTEADYMGYSPCVAFLNGDYWGMYEIRENMDEEFCENNEGVPSDQATVISSNYLGWNVINGSDASFYELYTQIMNADPQSPDFYNQFSQVIDFNSLKDYIIAETYYINGDWGNGWNNTKFWKDDRPGGKWRYMLMDLDFGLSAGVCDNIMGSAANGGTLPGQIFSRIYQNPQFREEFILRYLDLVNSVFRTENLTAIRDEMRAEADPAMPRHCQRWGSDYNWWYNGYDWRLDWNNQRQECIINVLLDEYGPYNPIDITLDVEPAGAGRVHISSIEPTEDQYPWTGTYFNGIPVQITAIANPGYTFSYWAANDLFPVNVSTPQFLLNLENDETFVAHFTGSPEPESVVISEFMFNDGIDADTDDWVELHNPLDVPLDISGYILRDANHYDEYTIPVHTIIPANGYLILARDPEVFIAQHPDVDAVIGPLDFNLSNSDDQIRLYNQLDELLVEIPYSDIAPWPSESDGTGRTVEYIGGDPDAPQSWVSGCIGGSPGGPYDPDCGTVGMAEWAAAQEVRLFPNPTRDEVFVTIPEGWAQTTVRLFDMTGQLSSELTNLSPGIRRIPLEGLASGVYMTEVRSASGSFTQRLIIR